jgi:hypothetical protein
MIESMLLIENHNMSLLSVEESSKLVGVSVPTMYRYISKGKVSRVNGKIDTSELIRVFGELHQDVDNKNDRKNDNHELSSLLQQIELLKSFNEELKKDKERLYEQVEFYQRLLPTQQNQDIQTQQQTDNDTIEQDYSFIDETLTQRFFRKLFWK